MRTPVKPLPAAIVRWIDRVRWLRRLDGVLAWIIAWAGATSLVRMADMTAIGVLATVFVAVAAMVPPLRAWWRPVTGLTALLLSWRLRPGDRVWRVTADGAELVLVTSRRGLHLVVAGVARDPAEGIAVRRTRTLLIRANGP